MRKMLAAVLLLPALAPAQTQTSFQTIGYQGLLKKSDGTPETQTVTITFRIFAASTGGTALWSEVQDVTPNSGGFYAVFLGSVMPFGTTLFNGEDRYLELQIQGDSTALTPRQQISSVPYALTAKNVDGGTSGTVTTGSVSAGSVTVSGQVTASGGVTGLPAPSATSDAATKGYVDGKFPITSNSSNIQLTGGNPSSSTGFANMLTPSNIPKAWAALSLSGGSVIVNDGFNISGATFSTIDLTVSFATALANANYVVNFTYGAKQNLIPYTHSRSTGSFVMRQTNTSGSDRDWSNGDKALITVYGAQ